MRVKVRIFYAIMYSGNRERGDFPSEKDGKKMIMFEEARSLSGMMKMCKITQSEMAKRLGVSQSYVANKLRLLKFDEKMQQKITESGISERHARALLRLGEENARKDALCAVIERSLTVGETEALVDFLHTASAPKRIGKADAHSQINVFKDTLKESIESLARLGVSARQSTDFYGTKTYITICIDES